MNIQCHCQGEMLPDCKRFLVNKHFTWGEYSLSRNMNPDWWIQISAKPAVRKDNFYTAWFSILIGYTSHDSVPLCLLGVITSFVVDPCHSWLTVGTSAGMLVCWDLRFQLPITNLSHPRGIVSVLWLTVKCWSCSHADFVYRTVLFKRFQALVFVGSPLTRSSSPGSCLLCRATMKWPCGIWRLERGDRLCGQAIPHPYHKHRFETPHPYHKHTFDTACKSQGLVPRRIYIPAAFLFAVPYHVQLNPKWLKNMRA